MYRESGQNYVVCRNNSIRCWIYKVLLFFLSIDSKLTIIHFDVNNQVLHKTVANMNN